ncbi:c-type cytochrome [Acetobacter conturbans]|uniref:C-type cytochrome n=1 Tax=Acetobacter conturbans TaxID=1737472 RepID=A0ABX0JXF1_9PROT|nr:c-type cytochrome [Acetobacter conturbans]NHN88019.1 c-type cytochrome [Acetobacter conturbans]
MDFATANRAAFAVLLTAAAMGMSWTIGSLAVPDLTPARPALAIVTEDDSATPLPAGNSAHGAVLVNAICSRCHDFTPSGASSAGPNLFGVIGRPVGKGTDYTYSHNLAAHGGTWDEATLNLWLRHPAAFAPGTRMSFRGLTDPVDRADIIAWLKTLH